MKTKDNFNESEISNSIVKENSSDSSSITYNLLNPVMPEIDFPSIPQTPQKEYSEAYKVYLANLREEVEILGESVITQQLPLVVPENSSVNSSTIYNIPEIPEIDFPSLPETSQEKHYEAYLKYLRKEVNDILGQSVVAHQFPFIVQENSAKKNSSDAVTKIQTWMRHRYRAKKLHREPALFGVTCKNTLRNNFYIWQLPTQFGDLAKYHLPPLFETTRHSSSCLNSILHDGVIYSREASKVEHGLSTVADIEKYDTRLIFSSPLVVYDIYSNAVFSLDSLAKLNGESLYFKFYDWAYDLDVTVTICPGIELQFYHHFPETRIKFKDEEGSIFEIEIPGEDLIFHGYNGLNRYLTFFIFGILNRLPPEQQDLKNKIYTYFNELGKDNLICHLQDMMKQILIRSEIDFINKVTLSFDSLESVKYNDKYYNFTELKTNIANDNVIFIKDNFISPLIKNSYFIAKGMLDYADSHNAQNIIAFVKEEFKQILVAPYYAKFIEGAIYAYKNHLSKPYEEADLFPVDVDLVLSQGIIYRPNHGFPHTSRVCSYIENVIDYYRNFAKDPDFRLFCENITDEQLFDIATAMLFSVTGRESELSFRRNPEAYNNYREASARHFMSFAENIYSREDAEKYRELIRYMGNPKYTTDINDNVKNNYIFHIMNMAHKLDLMRCYDKSKYEQSIAAVNDGIVVSSKEQKLALIELFKIVTQRILATGDRLLFSCSEDELEANGVSYSPELFFVANSDPIVCMALIQKSILEKQPKLFQILSDDIQNIIINEEELDQVFKLSEDNRLTFFKILHDDTLKEDNITYIENQNNNIVQINLSALPKTNTLFFNSVSDDKQEMDPNSLRVASYNI